MIKKNIILIVSLFLITKLLPAQVNDAGLWLSCNVEKKITQALSLNYTGELRLNENFSELGTFYNDIGMSYKFGKHVAIAGAYRFIGRRQLDDYYSLRHRLYFDLTLKEKISLLSVTGRVRIQNHYEDVLSSTEGGMPETMLRGKLTLKFDLNKKYSPYLSAETFIPLLVSVNGFPNKMRYRAGVTYKFNLRHSMDGYYMIQNDFGSRIPQNDFIIGLEYSFTF